MKIRVDDIRDKTKVLEDVEPVSHYPSLQMLEDSGECTFLEPLRLTIQAAREYDHIRVAGRVETRVSLSCSRCLREYELPISSPFTIFYSKVEGEPLDEEVELAEEDLISASYVGDEIDFTSEVAEQVVLEVPFKPLCREECKGLCSSCGADLNIAECGCSRSGVNLKFSALKDFKAEQ